MGGKERILSSFIKNKLYSKPVTRELCRAYEFTLKDLRYSFKDLKKQFLGFQAMSQGVSATGYKLYIKKIPKFRASLTFINSSVYHS